MHLVLANLACTATRHTHTYTHTYTRTHTDRHAHICWSPITHPSMLDTKHTHTHTHLYTQAHVLLVIQHLVLQCFLPYMGDRHTHTHTIMHAGTRAKRLQL